MNRQLRTATFKQKVAIEALKDNRTINEIAQEYGVHPVQVSHWKRELIEGAKIIFRRHRKRHIF